MRSHRPFITKAPHGGDVLRLLRVIFDLEAQAADIHVHDLELAKVALAPHGVENFLARERLAAVFHKELDDRVLDLRQLDALAVFFKRPVRQVQQKRRLIQLSGMRGRRVLAHAAHPRVPPRRQLGGGEGLGDIVVRAGHQARHLVHLLRARRQHDDADLRVRHADAAADFEPVDVRQHHVEQCDERVRILLELFERLLACGRLNGLVTGPAQVDDDEAADAGLVLKYENFLHVIRIPFQRRCVDAFAVSGVCFPGKQEVCRNIHFSISHNLKNR